MSQRRWMRVTYNPFAFSVAPTPTPKTLRYPGSPVEPPPPARGFSLGLVTGVHLVGMGNAEAAAFVGDCAVV
jgi:hypothetical protein